MKENIEETELVITNDVAAEGAEATPKQSEQAPQQTTEKGQKAEDDIDIRQMIRETVTEEDGPLPAGVTLIKILGGEFFTAKIIRRQIWLVLLIALFAVIYISNRYSCQKSMVEIDRLKTELKDAKYKALSTSSELTELSRESNVLDMLKQYGDSAIHVSDVPPYNINVDSIK